jgi:thiamine-monophosphate kinase
VRVADLGEFGLIARLQERLEARGVTGDPIVGIGDDAAVWFAEPFEIATTDTLVQGIHFPASPRSWRNLGWKALAVNVSDIAAMGGTPAYALVTLGLPGDALADDVFDLYEGLADCAEAYGVAVAGGDVVAAPVALITVALNGWARPGPDGTPALLRRDAGRPGDLVAVTGHLGGAAGGVRLLLGAADALSGAAEGLLRAQECPEPRLDAARAALDAGVRCAIDVSDGLVQDLGHICERSGCGAVLWAEKVPVAVDLVAAFPDDALELALSGGEDYELLFTGSAAQIDAVRKAADVPVTVVGELVAGAPRVRIEGPGGRELHLRAGGWNHFPGRAP